MKTQNHIVAPKQLLLRKAALLALVGLAGALVAAEQPRSVAAAPIAPAPKVLPTPPQPPPPPTQPASFLAWEADAKNYDAKPGELSAHFTCYVTNVSSEVVTIRELKRSCGCTEAKLPAQPWAMSPGTNGPITATMDLRGKTGRLTKTLTVESSAGTKVLLLNVNIPPAPAPATPLAAGNASTALPKATATQ